MALATYRKLALRWQPSQSEDRVFLFITTVTLVVMLLVGLWLSSIDVPERPREERPEMPDRVARFITEREKPEPPPPPPAPPPPRPPEPRPEVEPEVPTPVVERPREREVPEPVTEEQRTARERASQSGLLAHMNELNALREVSEVSTQVRGDIQRNEEARVAAGHSTETLARGVGDGSGGVDASRYAATAGETELTAAEVASAQQALAAAEQASSERREPDARVRAQEEITLVMDRHKGQLQNLYNRARRANPALQGKLVLAITILPDGTVDDIKVLSNELDDPGLERQLLARIRTFQFGAKDVQTVTVTYPIEFLPF